MVSTNNVQSKIYFHGSCLNFVARVRSPLTMDQTVHVSLVLNRFQQYMKVNPHQGYFNFKMAVMPPSETIKEMRAKS